MSMIGSLGVKAGASFTSNRLFHLRPYQVGLRRTEKDATFGQCNAIQ